MYRPIAVLCDLKNKPWLPDTERAISGRVAHRTERGNCWTHIPSLAVRYERIICSPVIGKGCRCGDEFVGVRSEGSILHHCCHSHSLLDIPPDVRVNIGILWFFLPQEHALVAVLFKQKHAIYSRVRGFQRRCYDEEQGKVMFVGRPEQSPIINGRQRLFAC